MARKPKIAAPFPTRAQVLEFVQSSPTPVGKREIARAFRLGPGDRVALKGLLRELERDGALDRGRGRRLGAPGALPEVTVVEVAELDVDGELIARPLAWRAAEAPPSIILAPERGRRAAPGIGDRLLVRLKRLGAEAYEATIMRRLAVGPARLLGVVAMAPDGPRLRPTDRRERTEFRIAPRDLAGAAAGELVFAEARARDRAGLPWARVVERLGTVDHPRSFSLLAIHQHGIPVEFPDEAVAMAERARPATKRGREDLREVPLVTIDGPDARDFDDAVWAEPDPDGDNPGGFRLLVAIADVAHYVTPGDALDRAAEERGNSVYFPDRVVPMLPEPISNGVCSLRPGEDRACLACAMRIDRDGRLLGHRFLRGLMRSAARLTYEQVQAARDGRPDAVTGPLLEAVIAPLYGAFAALQRARNRRGTLDLDLPEHVVELDGEGAVRAVGVRTRLDSHRLIEEMMIAANVAAAETLEARRQPCMYRVHEPPDPTKVDALREFLEPLGYSLPRGAVLRPRLFAQVLAQAEGKPEAPVIGEVVLRCQSQAVYSPENQGHFGLALARYAHFTSPIRRYADLLVHRALIRGLGFGKDGLPADAEARFAELGEHVSMTERRAAAAERATVERYVASWLASRVGEGFAGRIAGVTRFGLFVAIEGTGAQGLVPIRTLPADYYDHDEHRHALVGRATGITFRLGDAVEIRLAEADPVTGSLLLELLSGGAAGRPVRGRRGRQPQHGRRGRS